jgi:2-(1,2-epoxy-1,2-dihydrophenyl)acetyl-CoA isomerase
MIREAKRGAVATITLDDAATRNAIDPDAARAIERAAGRAGEDQDVRLVVLRGANGTFCSGGDLRTMGDRLALPVSVRRNRLARTFRLVRALREMPVPILAVIEGAATGAGLALALACDLRVASTTARLGAAFHRIGFTADFGMTHLLPEVLGPSRAMDLLLFGSVIDAAEALEIGLVHRTFDAAELDQRVEEIAARLVALPPGTVEMARRLVHAGPRDGLDAVLRADR